MEIVPVCLISAGFSIVQLLMMVVIILNPTAYASILHLGVNECFERVSIGKRLNVSDVSRSVTNTTLKQCDVECEREMCNAYAYGIGPRGNGSCDIAVELPKSPPNEDPDYDLFVRVLQCRNMIMCFKRLVPSRRLIDRYIRRTFPCDSLARCQLACSVEREFICEGFNYRFGTGPDYGNSCQLTAMPGLNLDLTLDFVSDLSYDFYTRDRNAPVACGHLTYKTWNYGYTRRTKIGDEDAWQRPQWIPGNVNSVPVQPRTDPGDLYNSNGYECFVRARTGSRLNRQIIVLTLNAPTLYDCEFVCANERKFVCSTLSYRYSTVPSTDNCQLGEKSIRNLDLYSDLVQDRDYDVYVRNEFSSPNCQPTKTWDTDCFERIRSGLSLDQSMVRFAVTTESLMDCELICLHIKHFTCRAFSFRYRARIGDYNCLLTDHPIPEMDPRRHFVDDPDCELYHRGSYGHGCEVDQWPHTPANRKDWVPQSPLFPPVKPTVVTVTPATLGPYYPSTSDYPSTTPSYNAPGHSLFTPRVGRPYLPPDPDCKYCGYKPRLPGLPTIPLPRPQVPSAGAGADGYDVYLTRKIDKLCYIAYGSPARLTSAAVAKSMLVVSEQECKAECSRARETTKFRCATISYWSGHCELSEVELRDLKQGQDFVQHDAYWLFAWDFTNSRCSSPMGAPSAGGGSWPSGGGGSWNSGGGSWAGDGKPWPSGGGSWGGGGGVWSSFTVSGRRCKWGTVCSHRADARIWSCPVEDGDWDYCCRPDHHCGYSEGYTYPWCYVGSRSREQWRPCSDSYYPYHGKRSSHWPISYVHKNGPPNSTAYYQPSLVDNFLQSLQFDKERSGSNMPESVTPNSSDLYANTSASSILEFQVVDLVENSDLKNNNNITDRSTNDELKRSVKKQSPSVT